MHQEKMAEIHVWYWDKVSDLTPGHVAVKIDDRIYELVKEGFKERDESQIGKVWAKLYLDSIIERVLPKKINKAIRRVRSQIEHRLEDTLRQGNRMFKIQLPRIGKLIGTVEKPIPTVFVYRIKVSSAAKRGLLSLCTDYSTHKRDMGSWNFSKNNCVHGVARLLDECGILHLETYSHWPHRFRQEELEKRVQEGLRKGEKGIVEKSSVRKLRLKEDNYVWEII